ncbi:Integrase core domain [Candidatus Rhabdochlamydia oedothoracis]|uniref:Integrase core domain n=1 Tax=Candidatus Rhabdochlamydia oedothoracis TaxID=2720720 RepID=A0ABX8V1P7_9BACT|nr:Integrase core domain [Candidatus Rhabdochlamydia oedothoracis]
MCYVLLRLIFGISRCLNFLLFQISSCPYVFLRALFYTRAFLFPSFERALVIIADEVHDHSYVIHKLFTATKMHKEIVPNYVNQNFTIGAPNQTWVSDISYIATREGWLYLAVVLDLFSRKIVGFSMSSRMQTDLVKRALQQAIMNRNPERGFIHHSDRDSQ